MRKVLETKLNSGNVSKAIKTWSVPVVRYSATFLRVVKTSTRGD